MNTQSLSFGARLLYAFGLVLCITAALAVVGVVQLGTQRSTAQRVAQVDVAASQLAQRWEADIHVNWVRTEAMLRSADADYVSTLQTEIDATSQTIADNQKKLESLVTSDAGKALMEKVASSRSTYRDLRSSLAKRKKSGEDISQAVQRDLRPLAQAYLDALAGVSQHLQTLMASAQEQAQQGASHAQWVLSLGGVLALVLGAVAALGIRRSVMGDLGGEPALATRALHAIKDGDLRSQVTVAAQDKTSLMFALAQMQANLIQMVTQVRQGSENVASASSQIAAGNHDLSGRTESQASALQQTAASMDQLGHTVHSNAQSAQQANQLAQTASTVALRGGEVVGQFVDTMKGINEASRKISDIISVIDGIAFQTNILALNAAVEAARAGEQGRGFAVVASEVRSLAGRSAEAAREIKSLISASVERVDQGTVLVDRAGATMQEVVDAIKRVTDIMGGISAASHEQNTGVAQIGKAVTSLDQSTQQNAALVEEMAAAAGSLNQQAKELVQAVSVFKLGQR